MGVLVQELLGLAHIGDMVSDVWGGNDAWGRE
jgi:hypothetical protein